MRRIFLALILGFVSLATGQAAHAAPIYSYVFDQSNYTVQAGQPVTVTVFLQETLGVNDTSRLSSASNDGLIAGGVNLTYPTSAFSGLPLITPNSGFDPLSVTTSFSPGTAGFYALVSPLAPTLTDPSPTSPFRVELATFTLRAGTNPGTYTVGTVVPNPTLVSNSTFNFEDVDPLSTGYGSATITIAAPPPGSAVPEPASWLLFSLAGLGLASLRRWSRHQKSG